MTDHNDHLGPCLACWEEGAAVPVYLGGLPHMSAKDYLDALHEAALPEDTPSARAAVEQARAAHLRVYGDPPHGGVDREHW
jgi:hypothetical protein